MRPHLHLSAIAALLLIEMQFRVCAVAPVQIVPVATQPDNEIVTYRETRYLDPMGDHDAPASGRYLVLQGEGGDIPKAKWFHIQ